MAIDRTPATALVGRDAELQQLLDHIGPDGLAEAVILGGDAGIGKTRLLTEVAARLHAADTQVLVGHCLDLGDGALPYQPFAEALARLDPDEIHDIADRFPAVEPLLSGRSGERHAVDRAELFSSFVAALDAAAVEQPLVVVIEDAHWADASTRHLIRYLLSYRFAHDVRIIISYRSDDLHRRHPLRQAVAEWVRISGVQRVELQPLADADVSTLVTSRADSPLAHGELTAVVSRAAGNAFFAEELLDAGLGGPNASLPATLADLLLVRLDRLDDDARQVVRAASCSGGRVAHEVLAQVAGLAPPDFDAAVRSAIDLKVLALADGDTYRFRHALLSEAVHDDLLPGERQRIHLAYLTALESGAFPGSAAERAAHALAARQHDVAFATSLEAATAAEQLAGHDEAARHYEQALTMLDAAPADTDVVSLVIAAGTALTVSGQSHRAVGLLDDFVSRPQASESVEDRGRLLVALGNACFYADHNERAAKVSREVFTVVPDEITALRAEAEALRARIASDAGDEEEAVEHGERALALAEQLDLDEVVADAKDTLTRLQVRSEIDPEKARRRYAELVETSRAGGHVMAELRGIVRLGFLHYDDGELDDAARTFREAVHRAEQTGWTWGPYGFDSRFFLAVVCYLRGQWHEVLALSGPGPDTPPRAEAELAAVALLVAAARGDATAMADIGSLRARWGQDIVLALHSGTAMIDLYGNAGDVTAAIDIHNDLAATLTNMWSGEYFSGRLRMAGLLIGQLASNATHADRTQRAEYVRVADVTMQQVAAVVEHNSEFGPEGQAWVARATAEAQRLRWAADIEPEPFEVLERSWRLTVTAFANLKDPYETARSQARLGTVLAAAGHDDAAALLATARQQARDLGATPLVAEIDAVSSPVRTASVRLTVRELEVLEHVSAGLSNGEIARRLFISTKTVSVHVSNILAKVGAASRTEAAAVARRQGLLDGVSKTDPTNR